MRTVKKTHNIKLREKGKARRDGFELLLCSENRFLEKDLQFEIVSGRDLTTSITTITTMAAGKGGPKRGNPAMRDEHTHAHC